MTRALSRGAAAVAVVFIVAVYGCDAGRGFVKDDFVWIDVSRLERAADLPRLLEPGTGFFRPVVSLSFAIDHALFGLAPLGYGWSNVAILVACAWALALLLRSLGIDAGVSAGAALVWALNFHGINMAVLWISGRTALLLTFWSVCAAWAWSRGRPGAAAFLALVAMGSKEEAFVVPAILTAWTIVDERRIPRRAWLLWAVAACALALRTWSGAYTPASAPSFYTYRFEGSTLAQNVLQYADRSITTPLLALVVFWLAAGRPSPGAALPGSLALKGLVWLLLGFVPTIFLPVRSSLYALFPSVGVVIAGAALADRLAARSTVQASRRAVLILLLVMAGLFPVYRARNRRYVREAELSASIVREVIDLSRTVPEGGVVIVRDARDVRPTAEQAFGGLADRAAQLVTGGRLRMWIDPPPGDVTAAAPDLGRPAAVLVVEGGRVRRLQ